MWIVTTTMNERMSKVLGEETVPTIHKLDQQFASI